MIRDVAEALWPGVRIAEIARQWNAARLRTAPVENGFWPRYAKR